MTDFISREALENWVMEEVASLDSKEDREFVIQRWRKEIPAADVAPVVHAEWVVSRTDRGWNCAEYPTHCKCTHCGRELPYLDRDNYCPRCGAKMDGGERDAVD